MDRPGAGARKGRAGRGRPNPRSARGPQTSLYGEARRLVAAARRWRGHGRWRRRAAVDRAGGGRISRQAGIVRRGRAQAGDRRRRHRSEEHTSELQSLMRISYAVFCLKKKNKPTYKHTKPENKRLNTKTYYQ